MYNNTIVEVDNISIEHTEELVDVYNFEVENAHTYYVTDRDILVHNDCISDELTKIANKYDDFKCVECADEMKSFLNTKGVKYQQVEIQFGAPKNGGYVLSDSLSRIISSNGYHTGIIYKGKVFDNLFKSGMEASKWINVFFGLGAKVITYL